MEYTFIFSFRRAQLRRNAEQSTSPVIPETCKSASQASPFLLSLASYHCPTLGTAIYMHLKSLRKGLVHLLDDGKGKNKRHDDRERHQAKANDVAECFPWKSRKGLTQS